MPVDDAFYAEAERRIEYVTLAIGAAGALYAIIFWGARVALGVALGAAFSWLNYRWIRNGVRTLARLARKQQGAAKVQVPKGTYFKFLAHYALLILGAYVILTYFKLLIVSVLAGFASLVLAVL